MWLSFCKEFHYIISANLGLHNGWLFYHYWVNLQLDGCSSVDERKKKKTSRIDCFHMPRLTYCCCFVYLLLHDDKLLTLTNTPISFTYHVRRVIREQLPTVYVYDHCPFCVRVRLALGVKNVKHLIHFLANDDIPTPTNLVGKKIAPIFVSSYCNYYVLLHGRDGLTRKLEI